MFFLLGLFDGRPADYLFMILFNGCILIVSFYDAKHAFSIKSVKLKMMFLYQWFQCLFVCCFSSSNKMHCLKSDMLLTVTSKMINAMNFSKSSSPSSYMKINFIFSANNKQECRYTGPWAGF